MNQYKQNINNLTDINVQQDAVLDELDVIESELDNLLPQYENDPEIQQLAQINPSGGISDQVPLRDQVFRNAANIDKEVEDLNGQLVGVQQTVDNLMMKSNKDAKYDCIGLTMQPGGNDNQIQATQDIEQILNKYYQALKWIQGTSIDLQYQTQEIETKINRQNQQNAQRSF